MPTEQSNERVKRWPMLSIGRLKAGDQTPEIHHGAVEHGSAWEHETYVPEGAANVLSPEEAREASIGLMALVGLTDDAAMERLAQRLSDFAEEADSWLR
jgi:hypothetical protein